MAGPLNQRLINRLVNPDPREGGLLLDTYLDADGLPHGASELINP